MSARSGLLIAWVLVHAGTVPAAERATNPVGGGASLTLEPAPPRQVQHQRRLVFACQDGGVVVFADRPCGTTALRREIDVVTPPDAGRSASTDPAPVTAAVKSAKQPAPDIVDDRRAAAATLCSRLREAVDALDQRMRAGYSAHEAARLWNRWREAKAQLHESRC